jgi:hypothetical protein
MAKSSKIDWAEVEFRFWQKVDIQFLPGTCDPDFQKCWMWKGSRTGKNGEYGQISIAGRNHKSHRIAFRLHYGRKIPDHLDGGHKCDTPGCNNPTHVRPCSHRANVKEWWFRYGRFRNWTKPAPRPSAFLPLTVTKLEQETVSPG